MNVSELLFEIKSTFDKEHKILNDYGLISKYANMELLILDDLGSEKMSEYGRKYNGGEVFFFFILKK